ncbi:MAG TPA: S8 family serine peptidase [Gaiellaceae bacterium]|nr:S8 family serine peptidase [Gaiellaceae bacterium]
MNRERRARGRGRLLAVLAAAAAVTGVLALAAQGAVAEEESPALASFTRLDTSLVQRAGWLPAALSEERQVTVILKVRGDSVAERVAQARRQGRDLSKPERDALRAELKAAQDALQGRIQEAGGRVLFDYQDAYNGIAVRAPLRAIPALAALPGVERVFPSRVFERDNTAGVQYVEGNDAWADLGLTGDGVKIAILDTGIDYFHANFGGSGNPDDFAKDNGTIVEPGSFPTAKVVAGTDLVGDDYNASDPARATPQPDPDPKDCNGHGSHVAGSAAGFGVLANGDTYPGPYDATTYTNTFRIGPGVAPEADLIAVRVFGCAGSTSEAVLVAALDYAFEQGADVVNMSLGSPFGRDDEPSTEASNDLAEAGTVVVASAGNSGAGAYVTGAPAVASRAISVAALDASSATFPGATIALSTGKAIVAQNSNGAALPSGSLPVAVLRTSYPDGPVSLGCDPSEYGRYPGGVAGKLVVTVRGVCARVARAVYGQKAGAAAVAMINTDSGFPPFEGEITSNPDTGEQFTVTIPFLGVRGVLGPSPTADGDDLVAADGGTATLSATTVPNAGYARFAGFTSGGPANVDSDAKPDVTAPGVSVLSTAVGTGNRGTRLSGTSMAAPMTAGVAALVTEAHPTWPTEAIKGAIVGTARVDKFAGGYNVRRGGTGVVDARRAVDTLAYATTSDGTAALNFGYEPRDGAYSETLPLTLHNTGGSAITYTLSTSFVGLTRGADVSFSANPVAVPAGGSATVEVTLALDAAEVAALPHATASNFGALAHIVQGAVVATPSADGPGVYPLRVPLVVVPRGLSNVTAGAKSAYTRGPGGTLTATIPLSNTGVHAGAADVYAWGIEDGNDVPGPADDPLDIRAAGVKVLPADVLGSTDVNDRALFFAVNAHGLWSNPSVNEIDIAIDHQNDGRAEFFVVGVDLGAVLAGSFNGQFASFIVDARTGALVGAWVAEAPMNGSTVVLPALASEIGLGPTGQKTFRYAIAGFSIVPGGLVDTTATAEFRPYDPPLTTPFAELAPGASASLEVSVDLGKFADARQLGWMIVTQDDANGGAQADLVPVGRLG